MYHIELRAFFQIGRFRLWIKNWKARGWKTADKKPVKNQDLWMQLDELNCLFDVEWIWVKGHAGIEYNEICDSLCQNEIKKYKQM